MAGLNLAKLSMATVPDNLEHLDPGRRFYKKLLLRSKAWCLVLAIVTAAIAVVGLPFVQGDYTFRGPRSSNGFVQAEQKLSAWYLGVTGWREVHAVQRQDHRLPFVLFIPVGEVLRLEPSFPYVRLCEH
jgi:hypothetical protein